MRDDVAAAVERYVEETAPVVLLVVDAGSGIIAANAHARRRLGEEVVGRQASEVFVTFHGELDFPLLARDPRAQHLVTLSLRHAPGVAEEISSIPTSFVFTFHPVVEGTLCLGSQDTDSLQRLGHSVLDLNRQLVDVARDEQKKAADLVRLDRLRVRSLGMASHDLRGPLTSILGCGRMLEELTRERLGQREQKCLRLILASAEWMRQLVENCLGRAVIESGRFDFSLAPCDLHEVMARAVGYVRFQSEQARVAVTVDVQPDVPDVCVDASKVEQVLVNLLTNALAHSPSATTVRASCRLQGDAVRIEVEDQGPGIPEEQRALIFEAFQRGSHPSTSEGVGLGLAIAHHIVQAHGGAIGVEGGEGGGARFWFTLPASGAEEAGGSTGGAKASRSGSIGTTGMG